MVVSARDAWMALSGAQSPFSAQNIRSPSPVPVSRPLYAAPSRIMVSPPRQIYVPSRPFSPPRAFSPPPLGHMASAPSAPWQATLPPQSAVSSNRSVPPIPLGVPQSPRPLSAAAIASVANASPAGPIFRSGAVASNQQGPSVSYSRNVSPGRDRPSMTACESSQNILNDALYGGSPFSETRSTSTLPVASNQGQRPPPRGALIPSLLSPRYGRQVPVPVTVTPRTFASPMATERVIPVHRSPVSSGVARTVSPEASLLGSRGPYDLKAPTPSERRAAAEDSLTRQMQLLQEAKILAATKLAQSEQEIAMRQDQLRRETYKALYASGLAEALKRWPSHDEDQQQAALARSLRPPSPLLMSRQLEDHNLATSIQGYLVEPVTQTQSYQPAERDVTTGNSFIPTAERFSPSFSENVFGAQRSSPSTSAPEPPVIPDDEELPGESESIPPEADQDDSPSEDPRSQEAAATETLYSALGLGASTVSASLHGEEVNDQAVESSIPFSGRSSRDEEESVHAWQPQHLRAEVVRAESQDEALRQKMTPIRSASSRATPQAPTKDVETQPGQAASVRTPLLKKPQDQPEVHEKSLANARQAAQVGRASSSKQPLRAAATKLPETANEASQTASSRQPQSSGKRTVSPGASGHKATPSKAAKEPKRQASPNRAGQKSQLVAQILQPSEDELQRCLEALTGCAHGFSSSSLHSLRTMKQLPNQVLGLLEASAIILGERLETKSAALRKLLADNLPSRMECFDPTTISIPQGLRLQPLLESTELHQDAVSKNCPEASALAAWCENISIFLAKTHTSWGAGSGREDLLPDYVSISPEDDEDEEPLDESDVRQPSVALSNGGHSGLVVEPDLSQLSHEELQNVFELTVTKPEVGSVTFHGLTDCTELDIDSTVVLKRGYILVYPDSRLKPPVGHGLNKRATVTMFQCFPPGEQVNDAAAVQDYKDKIQKMTEENSACKFIDYDCQTGIWKFEVERF